MMRSTIEVNRMACSIQCIPNASRDALVREALDVAIERQTTEVASLNARLVAARAVASKSDPKKRWLWRASKDAAALIADLEKQLAAASTSRADLRGGIEAKESYYARALEDAARTNGHRLITSSLHTVMSKKRATILMTNTNVEECLRAELRAELGLQEAPLLLTPGDVCDDCGIQMVVVSHDSMLSCTRCHKLRVLPNNMTVSAMHGTDVESSSAITKHRLPEWIEMAQAKEFGDPSKEAVDQVALYLVRTGTTGLEEYRDMISAERRRGGPFLDADDAIARLPGIDNLKKRLQSITSQQARRALHVIVNDGADGLRKFYERSAKIASHVSGYWPPRMNAQQEELLRMMYTTAAPMYEKRRALKQSSFPGGFPYFLRSLVVLLGLDEFADAFPIPPGSTTARDTLRSEIWSALGWELVPVSGKLSPITLPDGSVMQVNLQEDVDIPDDKTRKRGRENVKWTCS